jgi:hypothetical protein
MDGFNSIREVLSGDSITLDELDDETGIFDHADAFTIQSRGNETVEDLLMWIVYNGPGSRTPEFAIWDRVAEGIGNLQALREITIVDGSFDDGEEEDRCVPIWEILACILRRLRHGIHLRLQNHAPLLWDTETLPIFAEAIRGQAMITGFSTGNAFPFHLLDVFCSILLTLSALESVVFEHRAGFGPRDGQSFESMVELLKKNTLRKVTFEGVVFTHALCQAIARALRERSEITQLHFQHCSFPEGGGAVIASALATKTTLEHLVFHAGTDKVFYEALAAALLSNATLQKLSLSGSGNWCSWLPPLFHALQVNNVLKNLSIIGMDLNDEKLSTAMRLGLGNNSTLKELTLANIKSGDNDTLLWREALSFLHANTALKTLSMTFEENVTKSHASAIRMEVAAALHENESLENLFMPTRAAGLSDYLLFVAAIQPNTTLKKLQLHYQQFSLGGDEMKEFVSVLKKNYGLEGFPALHLGREGAGDIRSILDLNRGGRRYLVQDGSSISKGVAVLSRVSSNINSVFLHLLENPRLCDRSAVERSSSSIANTDNVGSTSPGNRHNGGKRESQAFSQPGKETRRRLD